MPQKRHLLLAERRHLRSSHRQCALSCRNPQGTLEGVPWWSKWRLVVLGEGRKVGVRPSHMLVTGHEPGLTASSARDTSLTAQYGSKHRQSSNSCASVALPHFPSARRAVHAPPTCGHERHAVAAVQRRVSDTRESDMCFGARPHVPDGGESTRLLASTRTIDAITTGAVSERRGWCQKSSEAAPVAARSPAASRTAGARSQDPQGPKCDSQQNFCAEQTACKRL